MIATALLTTDATLEVFEGSGSVGPVYGDKEALKGRFVGKRRIIKRTDGTEIISSGTLMVRPDCPATMLSKVTISGREYVVQEILPAEGLTRTEHLELLLS
jgi:hypothetical protein